VTAQHEALAALRSRVERLEAERDILRTLYAYSHHLDLGEDEAWAGCFTEDGVIDVHYLPQRLATARLAEGTRHAEGVRHQGRRQLLAFVAGHDHPPERIFKHLMVEPWITVEGDKATGVSYLVRVDQVDGAPRPTSFGRYHDRYTRVAPRTWKIAERVVKLQAAYPP
jgi:SnoaL-like domain